MRTSPAAAKQDRRVVRTEEALARAMIALALEKPYTAITIRDLTERAGVGYATFFRHFTDKEALLTRVLAVFVAELLALLPAGRAAGSGAVVFQYIAARQALCRVLLNSPISAALGRHIQQAAIGATLAQQRPRRGGLVPPEIAANHLAAASIALIQWWLEHDQPYPPERMGAIYEALVLAPTQALAFEPPDSSAPKPGSD
ncbi:MAG: TetR/AcrR family transcriptional regulator [Anaerolineales bacterium]|nr:TetR/AcrR family transcriptional regulator [Anaerolineales bacterium]